MYQLIKLLLLVAACFASAHQARAALAASGFIQSGISVEAITVDPRTGNAYIAYYVPEPDYPSRILIVDPKLCRLRNRNVPYPGPVLNVSPAAMDLALGGPSNSQLLWTANVQNISGSYWLSYFFDSDLAPIDQPPICSRAGPPQIGVLLNRARLIAYDPFNGTWLTTNKNPEVVAHSPPAACASVQFSPDASVPYMTNPFADPARSLFFIVGAGGYLVILDTGNNLQTIRTVLLFGGVQAINGANYDPASKRLYVVTQVPIGAPLSDFFVFDLSDITVPAFPVIFKDRLFDPSVPPAQTVTNQVELDPQVGLVYINAPLRNAIIVYRDLVRLPDISVPDQPVVIAASSYDHCVITTSDDYPDFIELYKYCVV